MTNISIITGRPEHWPLILDSFWHEYQRSPIARGVPAHVLGAKMTALLSCASWRLLVAVPEGQQDEVMGYLVNYDVDTVGWLHTLRSWRGRGVAKALLAHAGIQRVVGCAFLPPEVAREALRFGWHLRLRPYLPDLAAEETARTAAALVVG